MDLAKLVFDILTAGHRQEGRGMKRNPYGWHYPPGAEHDPRAPWNQKEQHPEGCSDCDYLEYNEEEDVARCIEGDFKIEGSLNDVPPGCPLDRRSEAEAREDYLADMADRKRKGEL